MGNRVGIGLLSAWRKSGRDDERGGRYHYLRSCPVAEVRVSQLVWSREGEVVEVVDFRIWQPLRDGQAPDYECDLLPFRGGGARCPGGGGGFLGGGGGGGGAAGTVTVPDSACSEARELARLTACWLSTAWSRRENKVAGGERVLEQRAST